MRDINARLKFRLASQIALALPVDTNPIDSWSELAAMVTVVSLLIGGLQFLITKLMVMPVVADSIVKWNENMKRWSEEADRRYVRTDVFEERRDSLDYMLSRHFTDDDRRQESFDKRQEGIEKRLESIIALINDNNRRHP